MFVVSLTYLVPLERVDALLAEHVAWLDRHYGAGVFLASGRKEPRTGGVILAVAGSRAEVEEIVAADPFAVHGIARHEVTEVLVTRAAPELASALITPA
ncbi:YciI family protein [Longispora sp. NPDC051575]|uniref:YciI family protein n=1 Tax=Longispora sp. NPDC051575 TaxID=3154943 RepID=UPI0034401BC4